jgi:transposase
MVMERQTTSKQTGWGGYACFLGLDWAQDHHAVVTLAPGGQIVLDMQIAHDAEGWQSLRQKLMELAGADLSVVAATVETTCGPAVERLFELGCAIYPINPKAGERYRERKVPCGGKSDHLDAWSFADALRTDGHAWRRLSPEDPRVQELRLLCRDERHLVGQRTALVNQLRQALQEYYPAALEAFDDWTVSPPWDFIVRFPSPAELVKARKRAWEKFLHTHQLYRPSTYAKRLEIFARAQQFCGTEPVTKAKSLLAVSLAKQLKVLQRQLDDYRERIEQLFREHPDHDLFGSLPGAGSMLAPRLLSECGQDRQRFEDHEALQCYAGTAPVSFQSGQIHVVHFRWACNRQLRAAVHLWADCSRKQCTWAQVYYQHKRQEGKSHACAIRCLGQRWLKILWKMWQTRQPYDEQLHTRNQVRHGSWVLALGTAK